MNEPIVSIDQIAKQARRATSIDECPYPEDSAAWRQWMSEFAYMGQVAAKDERRAA